MTDPTAATLVEAALDQDIARVRDLLAADPRLATHSFATALVCGQSSTVIAELAENPAAATTPLGRRQMPPIFFATRSCLVRHLPATSDGFCQSARALVAAGADVNARHPFDPPFASSSGTPLYYAAGLHAHHALTRTLIEIGATPNDTETLYHAVEHDDPELLRILHSAGVDPAQWSYAFLHLMDYEFPTTVAAMADLGIDHNAGRHPHSGETPLHWAIKHGRSPRIIRLLLNRGADPAATDYAGVTPYGLAARYGDIQSARLMESAGHHQTLSPVEQLLLAAALGDTAQVAAVRAQHPGVDASLTFADRRAIVRAAFAGRTAAVRGLVTLAHIDPSQPDESGATALHQAALHAHTDTAAALLDLGASPHARDRAHNATPLGWACWASINPPFDRVDHTGVVRALLAAGSTVDPNLHASDPINAILAAR